MATAKSDDESEERSDPVTQERPGVYGHVLGAARRRGQARAESGEMAIENVAAREPITVPGETVELDQFRPSDLELTDTRDSSETGLGSENTNHRADLMVVSLPAPPRVPNLTRAGEPLSELLSASLLDAPHSLRPDSLPVRSGPSWLLLGCVAVCSFIIAAAGVVALREPAASQSAPPLTVQPLVGPQPEEPSGFARYAAEDAAKQAALAAKQAAEQAARQQNVPIALPATESGRALSARVPEAALLQEQAVGSSLARPSARFDAAGRADVASVEGSRRARRRARTEHAPSVEQPVALSEPAASAAPPEVTAQAASVESAAPVAPAAEPTVAPDELPPNPYAQ